MTEKLPDGLASGVLEASNAPLVVTTGKPGDYAIVYVNPAFTQMTGHAATDLLGRNPRFLHGDDRAQDGLARLRQALAEDQPAVAVLRNYRKDGSRFFVELRLAPVRSPDNSVAYWIGVYGDVSADKFSVDRQEESEGRFRLIVDVAPVMIWMSDANKNCVYVNKGWLEFTGRSLQQVLGDGWLDSVHRDDRLRCVDIFGDAFDRTCTYRIEYRLRRRDGAFRWILETGVPCLNASGRFQGYVSSCVDVTDRVEAAREVLAREAKFRAIAERTYDWESWIGPHKKPLWINPSVERITGYTIADCMTMRHYPLPIIHREDRQRVFRELKQAHGNNVPFRIIRKDGSIGWAAISWQVIKAEDGQFAGLRTSVRELSQTALSLERSAPLSSPIGHR